MLLGFFWKLFRTLLNLMKKVSYHTFWVMSKTWEYRHSNESKDFAVMCSVIPSKQISLFLCITIAFVSLVLKNRKHAINSFNHHKSQGCFNERTIINYCATVALVLRPIFQSTVEMAFAKQLTNKSAFICRSLFSLLKNSSMRR